MLSLGARDTDTQPEVLAILIEAGADLEETHGEGMTPLMEAAKHDYSLKKIDLLLEAGATVNVEDDWDYTSLHHAARHNPNPEALAVLLSGGADCDATTTDNDSTPMELAIKFNPMICKSGQFRKLQDATGDSA